VGWGGVWSPLVEEADRALQSEVAGVGSVGGENTRRRRYHDRVLG
jgi:hypothetical protein